MLLCTPNLKSYLVNLNEQDIQSSFSFLELMGSFSTTLDLFVATSTLFAAFLVAAYFLDFLNAHKRRTNFQRLSAKMETHDLTHNSPQKFFPQFSFLHEDLAVNIISFVADVPLENPHAGSTVTGVLPLVCKQFNQFCKSDFVWQTALKRLRTKDPCLWDEGLLRLLPHGQQAADNLVDQLHQLLGVDYKSIFRRVVDTYIRFTGPVFYMTGVVRMGHAFGLHFFEPRYRVLIAEVLRDWPASARRGVPISANLEGRFPTFIYAHMAPLAPTTPACLVQVRECVIHGDGSADVMLEPVSYVWLERVWERANSGRLCEATCLRMGRDQVQQMESQGRGGRDDSDILQFLAQNGGLENPTRGAMNAVLSYILAGRAHVVVGGDSGEDEEEDDDDLGNDDADDTGDDQSMQDRQF